MGINMAFFRFIASLVILVLIRLKLIEAHNQETLADILTIVFAGLGFISFGVYEIWHVFIHRKKHETEADMIEKRDSFIIRIATWFIDKAFIKDAKYKDIDK